MDLTRTVEPRSDQLNYDDVALNPVTVTVTEVKKGTPEQPVELHTREFPGRPYKPSKSMRRVLIAAWGVDGQAYVGKRVTLYGDPTIRFGKEAVGGIRIAALSHVGGPVTVQLTVSRGKREPFTVQPLPSPDVSGRDWLAELELAGDDRAAVEALGVAAKQANASAEVLGTIRAKFQQLREGS